MEEQSRRETSRTGVGVFRCGWGIVAFSLGKAPVVLLFRGTV